MKQTIQDIKDEIQVVNARMDLEVTHRIYQNRINDLDRILAQRDRLHTINTILTYLFHACQGFGVLCTSISTALQLNEYVFFGIGLNVIASIFEALRQYNTRVAGKKLKDLDMIKNNTYLDEGEVEADVQQDRQRSDNRKQKINYSSDNMRPPERAVLYAYNQQKQNYLLSNPTQSLHSVHSVHSASSETVPQRVLSNIQQPAPSSDHALTVNEAVNEVVVYEEDKKINEA